MDVFEKMDIVQNELENYAMALMNKYELTEYAMIRAIVGAENTMRKCALARKAYSAEYADNQMKLRYKESQKQETKEEQEEVVDNG